MKCEYNYPVLIPRFFVRFAHTFIQLEIGRIKMLQKMSQNTMKRIIEEINPFLEGGSPCPDTSNIIVQDLPFYQDYCLLDIKDSAKTPPFRRLVLYKTNKNESDVIVVNGTKEQIYELSKKANINLRNDNIYAYVKFFFSVVRGQHGYFNLVEDEEDIKWISDSLITAKKEIKKFLQPVVLEKKDENGSWHLTGCFVLARALFKARVSISKDGEIDIVNQEVLAESLPVRDDLLGNIG